MGPIAAMDPRDPPQDNDNAGGSQDREQAPRRTAVDEPRSRERTPPRRQKPQQGREHKQHPEQGVRQPLTPPKLGTDEQRQLELRNAQIAREREAHREEQRRSEESDRRVAFIMAMTDEELEMYID